MREPKNQMLGTMEHPLMQLSVNVEISAWHWIMYKLKRLWKYPKMHFDWQPVSRPVNCFYRLRKLTNLHSRQLFIFQ